jgi:hypothetical protein
VVEIGAVGGSMLPSARIAIAQLTALIGFISNTKINIPVKISINIIKETVFFKGPFP